MGPEYEQAIKEKPPAWFEKRSAHYIVALSGVIATAYGMELNNIPIQTLDVRELESLYLPLISASVYFIGQIMDTESTVRVAKLINETNELGIDHPVFEGNPLMPKHPTPEEVYKGPVSVVNGIELAVSFLVPPIGFGVSLSRGLAYLNNSRNAQRLERVIEINAEN